MRSTDHLFGNSRQRAPDTPPALSQKRVVRSPLAWPRRLAMLLLSCSSICTPFTLSAATYGQEVLAAVLLAEARGEGEAGMRAVAEVVRRRADDLNVSMLSVLKQGAFSSLNGTNRDALLKHFYHHPQFEEALKIARIAYNSPAELGNLTHGANHFTHKREKPYWAAGHHPVIVIGNHAFYHLPVSPG